MTMEKEKKAYNEILNAIRKNKDLLVFDLSDLEYKAKAHLFGLELKEKYGLNIDPKRVDATDYERFSNDRIIGLFGEKRGRMISWPVDGRQPKDEYLFTVSFPTGAYIFGEGEMFNKEYPTEFFQRFWNELKGYKPDYVDEVNHGLYWKLENAKEIFNNYESVLGKYHDLNKEDVKLRRIEKMKKELAELEKS